MFLTSSCFGLADQLLTSAPLPPTFFLYLGTVNFGCDSRSHGGMQKGKWTNFLGES